MPVDADAVDAAMGPVRSFLPPGPNFAAQALLAQPVLRSLAANDLAQKTHVSVADARQAIGSIVGMIQRTARGNPNSPLQVETSLGQAVGPFMSLDTAMSRYGSNMGAIVSSPVPHSAAFAPDYPPDRQASAGRLTLRRRSWPEAGDDTSMADDTPPPIDSNPGSQTSNEATDQGNDSPGAPALSTTVAPIATISPDPSVPIGPGSSPANPTGATMSPTGLTTPGGSSKWLLIAAAAGVGLFALSKSKHKPKWLAKVKIA